MTMTRETRSESPAEQGYRAVDLDQHFFEPSTIWDERLPAKFKGMGPTHVTDSMGIKREVLAGVTLPRLPRIPWPRKHPAFASASIDAASHYGFQERLARAGWDPKARLELFDEENVSAALIYPTAGLHFSAITEVDVYVALCRAYNDWAAEYVSHDPTRLAASALVPQLSVKETVAETIRTAELGLKGIVMRPNPVGRTIEDPAWEPLWATLDEMGTWVAFHEGASLCNPQLGADRTDNYIFQHMMSHPFEHMAAMLALIGGGVLDRHPNMKALFVEAGCGWVPYWLERMEHHFEAPYEAMQLSLTPTELFQRQCFVSADAEEGKIIAGLVDCIGADNICWSTDFPHPDHDWGGLVSRFTDRQDIAEAAKRKIVGENAAALVGF